MMLYVKRKIFNQRRTYTATKELASIDEALAYADKYTQTTCTIYRIETSIFDGEKLVYTLDTDGREKDFRQEVKPVHADELLPTDTMQEKEPPKSVVQKAEPLEKEAKSDTLKARETENTERNLVPAKFTIKHGITYFDSRQVAVMVDKRHDNLVRDIDGYYKTISENISSHSSKLRADDYFKKSSYKAGTGKTYPCYLISKMGCEFIGNKMTGDKGILFTAMYVKLFNEMETIQKQKKTEYWQYLRARSKEEYKALTDMIKIFVDYATAQGSKRAKFYYIAFSKLTNGTSYQIKIDGSIAKNSQTNQFFDGDGDGEEGGDYVLDFTIEPLDLTAPEIVSVDPAVDGEALGTNRPTIRIELSEEINWNEDKYVDLISVKDSDGKTYGGSISHAVIGGISVIHYKLAEDLPLDKCIQVSVNGGIEDFGGNQSEPYSWKFLTEYRPVINRTMVSNLDSEAGWWAPAGSGSSAGLVQDANSWAAVSDSYSVESAGSCKLTYAFDAMATTPSWMIRQYCSSAAGVVVANNVNGMLNFWLYGDGSNNKVSVMVRANNGSGGLKHPVMIPVSFRGWKHITWDMKNDPYEAFTGTEELNGAWILDSFFIVHENTDDTPDVPQQAWEGEMLFDDLEYIIYDETAVRTATLDDFDSVDELETSRLYVYMSDGVLHVEEPALKAVSVYNVSGQEIAGASATESFAFDMSACPNGIYIVKIQTENGIFSQKIIK